jgi:hypothetical protein
MEKKSDRQAALSFAVILLASFATQCGDSSTLGHPQGEKRPDLSGKPTADDYYCEVQTMVDFGPRLTGFPAHKKFLNYISVSSHAGVFCRQ